MPSRKRDKGRARRANAVLGRSTQGTEQICWHGSTANHGLSVGITGKFKRCFLELLSAKRGLEKSGVMSALKECHKRFPSVCKSPDNRNKIIEWLVSMGTSSLLDAAKKPNGNQPLRLDRTAIEMASAVILLQCYDPVADIFYEYCDSAREYFRRKDITEGCSRSIITLFRKMTPCNCLDSLHRAAKSQRKTGLCHTCHVRFDRTKLFVCTRCDMEQYCSEACQLVDLPSHRRNCDHRRAEQVEEVCTHGLPRRTCDTDEWAKVAEKMGDLLDATPAALHQECKAMKDPGFREVIRRTFLIAGTDHLLKHAKIRSNAEGYRQYETLSEKEHTISANLLRIILYLESQEGSDIRWIAKKDLGIPVIGFFRDRIRCKCLDILRPAAALKPEEFASATPEVQKNMIGERLSPLIFSAQPERECFSGVSRKRLAGKITEMLLELDNSKLLNLLKSSEALDESIREAVQVLKEIKWKG